MNHIKQKINLMSVLTSFDTLSEKILDNSSMKNKEIKKLIKSHNGRKVSMK